MASSGGDIELGCGTSAADGCGSLSLEKFSPPEFKGPLKPVAETTPVERLTAAIAAITVVLALVAISVEQTAVVIVAGILSIAMGPYAYFQQTRLTDIATLKETTAALELEVERLEEENKRLASTVDELAETVDDLQDLGDALDVISSSTNQSVITLEQQVEENKEILAKMKKSTRGRIIQNLISIIYRGDSNADNVISEEEATGVILGLKDVSGVTIHEERLRAAIVGKSVESIVDVVQNLLNNQVPKEDRIFEITN
jgi:hypothetical protein